MTSEEAVAKAKEIESAISSREGTVVKQSAPVAKTLSYPIKKRGSGFLCSSEFQLDPEKIIELKEILAKDQKIVRHMLIIKEAAQFKKERRTREGSRLKLEKAESASSAEAEKKAEVLVDDNDSDDKKIKPSEPKEKVELKDIEHELDEILG